ncbi:hypothetical protein CRYUN_Cryun23aG0024200 [Craigia yunnanensis]
MAASRSSLFLLFSMLLLITLSNVAEVCAELKLYYELISFTFCFIFFLIFACRLMVVLSFVLQIANQDALIDAQQHRTRSHACSFVSSAVPNAYASLLELMETSKSALATTIGRPRKEDPSALKLFQAIPYNFLFFFFINKTTEEG